MITTSLIHIAVWTNLAVAAVPNLNTERHSAELPVGERFRLEVAPGYPEDKVEKVVLRNDTMSEKFGLGVETTAKPDAEIAALQADASNLKESIRGSEPTSATAWETPNMHKDSRYNSNWSNRFVVKFDDDGSCTLGKKRLEEPPMDESKVFSFFVGSNH